MATQGLVTIVSGGKVLMKIVTGSDGEFARSVANRIKKQWPLDTVGAYAIAKRVGFGHEDDLVVIDQTSVTYLGDGEVGSRYRETFDRPEFNPRWEFGTADHVIVISV
jgi:hypothetical protein